MPKRGGKKAHRNQFKLAKLSATSLYHLQAAKSTTATDPVNETEQVNTQPGVVDASANSSEDSAKSVTLETGDVKPLTEFIIFTTLPTEVQLKIWKHCVSLQPRIVGQTWGTCDAVACDGNEQVILRQVSHTTREETLKSLGYSAITLTGPYFDQTDPYPKFLFNPDIDLFFMDGELIQDGTVKDARCIAMIDWMFNDKAMSFLQQFDSLDLIFIVCEEVKVAQLSKDGSDKRRVIFQVLEGRPTWELGNVAPEKMKALIARGPNKKTIPQVECVKLIREKPSMKGLKGFEQFVGQGRIMDDLMLAMTRSLQGMA